MKLHPLQNKTEENKNPSHFQQKNDYFFFLKNHESNIHLTANHVVLKPKRRKKKSFKT